MQFCRSSGIALLLYLDRVAGSKTDGTEVLDQKLALATSKPFRIADLSKTCGIVRIGIAQLIPGCHVVVIDNRDAEQIICRDIEVRFPAISSTAEVDELNLDDTTSSTKGGKMVDLALVTDFSGMKSATSWVVKIIKDLL